MELLPSNLTCCLASPVAVQQMDLLRRKSISCIAIAVAVQQIRLLCSSAACWTAIWFAILNPEQGRMGSLPRHSYLISAASPSLRCSVRFTGSWQRVTNNFDPDDSSRCIATGAGTARQSSETDFINLG